jgi:hypothetical protein
MKKHEENADLITAILDDYRLKSRRGEKPSIEDYLNKYPGSEAEIRDAFEVETQGFLLFANELDAETVSEEKIADTWPRITKRLEITGVNDWLSSISVNEWLQLARKGKESAKAKLNQIKNWIDEALNAFPLAETASALRVRRVRMPKAEGSHSLPDRLRVFGSASGKNLEPNAQPITFEIVYFDRVKWENENKLSLKVKAKEQVAEKTVDFVLDFNGIKVKLGKFDVRTDVTEIKIEFPK